MHKVNQTVRRVPEVMQHWNDNVDVARKLLADAKAAGHVPTFRFAKCNYMDRPQPPWFPEHANEGASMRPFSTF